MMSSGEGRGKNGSIILLSSQVKVSCVAYSIITLIIPYFLQTITCELESWEKAATRISV